MGKVVDTLRKTNNVKAFWPYYNLAPQQKVQANADREISGGTCAKPLRKGTEAYLMLQEQDIWVNDASSTSTISPARVNSWYSLFENMETSTADKKVTKFELSYTFGFEELNVMTLLQQQMPEAAFLAGLALDELCVSSVDLALKHAPPFMLLLVLRPVGFQNEQLPRARVPQLACNPSRLRCCDKRSSAFSGSIIPCFLSFAIISRTNEGACAPNESRVYSFLVESSGVMPSPDGDAPAPQQSRPRRARELSYPLVLPNVLGVLGTSQDYCFGEVSYWLCSQPSFGWVLALNLAVV